MRGASAFIAALTITALAACGQLPATEVLLTIDATPEVLAKTDSLQVQIAGSDHAAGPFTGATTQGFGPPRADVRFPRVFALVPSKGDASRHFQVFAVARNGSQVVATSIVRSGYLEHRLLHLTLLLDETACSHPCATGETCRSGRCEPIDVDPMTLGDGGTDLGPQLDATLPDGGLLDAPGPPGDATLEGGPPPDADVDAGCGMDPAPCDDHVGCTHDLCDATGNCMHIADATLCTAGSAGTCDPVTDCQYSTCTPSLCVPDFDTCMDATCMGAVCNRASSCHSGTVCCHGECAEPGCDDGNACTTDVCTVSGCSHVTVSCDDSNFCTDDMCDVMAGCVHASNYAECMSDPTSCVYSACDGSNVCQTTFCMPPSTCCSGTCTDFTGEIPPAC